MYSSSIICMYVCECGGENYYYYYYYLLWCLWLRIPRTTAYVGILQYTHPPLIVRRCIVLLLLPIHTY